MILSTLVLATVICALGAWIWWMQRPPALRSRVIVNLVSSDRLAVRGVWWKQHGSWLIVRDAAALPVEGPPVRMDGDVLIHRSNVAFVQVLTPDDRELVRQPDHP